MANLSTQPYKGTRDFYPEDMRLQKYIFSVWRTIAEAYGYEEYNGPTLELTDLYRSKTGEEIVNEQSYTFTDRGGREVTMRPEMTPTLARMVAARQQELNYPLRLYNIGNRFRYERPQKGRFREFWQMDVDIFGVEDISAELEVIKLASNIMKAFGAKDEMYKIRINSRKLVSLLLGEYLKLDIQDALRMTKLIDRKDKMSEAAFAQQAESIMGKDTDKLMALLSIKSIDGLPADVIESGTVEDLRQLFEKLSAEGVNNAQFDLTLMRGLDYYTGIVFEIFDTSPDNNRSMFGGGRYDDLTAVFGAPSIPAFGFAYGDAVMSEFLIGHNLVPDLASSTKVAVLSIGDTAETAQNLSSELRKAGINVALDTGERKIENKLKATIKNKIPFAIFVGEEEAKSQMYSLKDLKSQKEQKLSTADIVQKLK
jgi:histidyl-tRNA synthetase